MNIFHPITLAGLLLIIIGFNSPVGLTYAGTPFFLWAVGGGTLIFVFGLSLIEWFNSLFITTKKLN